MLNGHRQSVTCLAMSPDGRWLASAAHDRSVILWDTQRGEAQWAATAGPDEVWLIDLSSGASSPLEGLDDGRVETLIFSLDGRLLLTNGLDDCVRVWETRTATQLWNTQQADGSTFHPNKRSAATSTLLSSTARWSAGLLAMRQPLRQSLQSLKYRGSIGSRSSQRGSGPQPFLDNCRNIGFRSPSSPLLKLELVLTEPFQASRNIRNLLSLGFRFGTDTNRHDLLLGCRGINLSEGRSFDEQ